MEFDAAVQTATGGRGVGCDRLILPIPDGAQFLGWDALANEDANDGIGSTLRQLTIAEAGAESVGVTANLYCHVRATAGDLGNFSEFGHAIVREDRAGIRERDRCRMGFAIERFPAGFDGRHGGDRRLGGWRRSGGWRWFFLCSRV